MSERSTFVFLNNHDFNHRVGVCGQQRFAKKHTVGVSQKVARRNNLDRKMQCRIADDRLKATDFVGVEKAAFMDI